MAMKTFNLYDDINTINTFTENCQHYNLRNSVCKDCGLCLDGNLQISKEVFGKFIPGGKTKHSCIDELEKFNFPPDIIVEADRIYCNEFVEGKTFRQDVRLSIHTTTVTEAYYRSGNPMDPRLIALKVGLPDTKAKHAITIGNENKTEGVFSCTNMVVQDYIKCYLSLCKDISTEVKEAILVLTNNLLKKFILLTNFNFYTLAAGIICYYGQTRKIDNLSVQNVANASKLSVPTINEMKKKIYTLENK